MKRIRLGLLGMGLAVIAAGCASNAPEDPKVAEVRSQVDADKTEFDSHLRIEGPRHERPDQGYWAMMRSWLDENKLEYTHQLYVKVSYTGAQRDYRSANYPGGRFEEIKVIDRVTLNCDGAGLHSCERAEHVGLFVTEKQIKRALKAGGLRLRINAKRGDALVVSLPGYYLEGYLDEIEARESYARRIKYSRSW